MDLTGSSSALTWAHVFGQICWRFKTSTEALSDPEIKSHIKNERKTHTEKQLVWMNGHKEREKEEGKERAWSWILKEHKWVLGDPQPQNVHWVCIGDDVSVNYKSADRYENKSHHRPQCVNVHVCIFMCYFKTPNFMNECDISMVVCVYVLFYRHGCIQIVFYSTVSRILTWKCFNLTFSFKF